MNLWDTLELADRNVTLHINSLGTPFLDKFWITVTGTWIWIPFYALLLALVFLKLGWKKTLLFIAVVALVVLACDQSSNLVKHLSERLRPCNDPWMTERGLHMPLGAKGKYGFYSAHACNTFGFAIYLWCILKDKLRSRKCLFLGAMLFWACLVSVSRIFVARHFLGDIIAGGLAGCLIGYLMSQLYRIVSQQVFAR